MKNRPYLLSLLLLVSIGLTAFKTTEDPIARLMKALQEFSAKYPQEKIHLHLDKPYYTTGDYIWFKAYVTDSRTNGPSNLSNVLYVELINEQDVVTEQVMVPMIDGITWGDFKLSDTLAQGNYRLRAYTQWMRNIGPDYFFDKTLKIANTTIDYISATTSYEVSQGLISTIRFTKPGAEAVVDSKVSYELVLNNGTKSKGQGTTNQNGELNVPIIKQNLPNNVTGHLQATITLANKEQVRKTIPIRFAVTNLDVQFFPEGGNLIQGFPNKIGIKAVNANGKGEDISGVIIDADGTEVTQFETSHLGMGHFSLSPMPDKTYRAKLTLKDGAIRFIDLPKALPTGYVLTLSNIDTANLSIKVLRTQNNTEQGELHLLGQQHGNVCFSAKIPTRNLVALSVPKQSLPSGVITFTLFSSENKPLAERLAFVNNSSDHIKLHVSSAQSEFKKREPVSLTISTKSDSTTLQGSFSVSITNQDVVIPDDDNETNILTSFFLSSDLKGYIEKPNYYFQGNDVKRLEAIDNLMLTQGWRKINWENLIDNKLPKSTFEPENSLQIRGTLFGKNNAPVANGKISLFSSTNGVFANSTMTDENGKFVFDELDFNDSTRFTLQGSKEKKQNSLKVKWETVPPQSVGPTKNLGDFEADVHQSLKGYLENAEAYFSDLAKNGMLNRTITLKEVAISGEKKKKVENSANLNGPGSADAVLMGDEIMTSVTLSQALTKVMGIKVTGGQAYSIQALASSMGGVLPMKIVVDGQMMSENFSLATLSTADIASVEVLRSPNYLVIYGIAGGGGVIVITTKRGGSDVSTFTTDENGSKITYQPKGYQVAREFYVPKFDNMSSEKLDLRPLVYWKPNSISGPDGKFTIDFNNTDQAGTYRLLVEGMDIKGNLGRKIFTYKVQ